MATGDVTVSISIEGGVTKSVGLASDVRIKSKAHSVSNAPAPDPIYQLMQIGKLI